MRVIVASLFALLYLSLVCDHITAQERLIQRQRLDGFEDILQRTNVADEFDMSQHQGDPIPIAELRQDLTIPSGGTPNDYATRRITTEQFNCMNSCIINALYEPVCGVTGSVYWNWEHLNCARKCGLSTEEIAPHC